MGGLFLVQNETEELLAAESVDELVSNSEFFSGSR